MAAIDSVLVGGVEKIASLRAVQNVRATYVLGARTTLDCEFVDLSTNTATAYRPAVDNSLVLKAGSTSLVSGSIVGVRDSALGEPNVGVVTKVNVVNKMRAAGQRLVKKTYTGASLKTIVTDLGSTYLTGFGITVDPFMATGPTVTSVSFDYVTVEAALNKLSDLTGWVYRLLPTDVLEMFAVGARSASYSLTSSNAKILGGVEWSKTRGKYVNTQYVRYGTATQVEKTDTFVADGATQGFTLTYPVARDASGNFATPGYFTLNGASAPLYTPYSGITWSITGTGPQQLFATSNPAAGTTISIRYTAQFPDTVSAVDAAEVTAQGIWDDMVDAPETFDKAEAQTLAAALLRRYKAVPRQVTIETRAGQVFPGDIITITVPERTLSGSWLITSVEVRDAVDQGVIYRLTCLEGSEAQSTWVDFWRDAIGSSSSSGGTGTISGGLVPVLSGSFTTDLVSNAAVQAKEAALTQFANSQNLGSAIRLGRVGDTTSWVTVADDLNHSPAVPKLRWLCEAFLSACRYHLQGYIPAGTMDTLYLTPDGAGSGVLNLGAPSSLFGNNNYRVNVGYFKDVNALNGVSERGRATKMGDPIPVAFNAANFTGDTGTWTLTSGDHIALVCSLEGRHMTVAFQLQTTSVSGSPNYLKIAIPGGYTAAYQVENKIRLSDNGTVRTGVAVVVSGENVIRIYRDDLATFTTSTNLTDVRGVIPFWVNEDLVALAEGGAMVLDTTIPHEWSGMQTFTDGVTIGDLELRAQLGRNDDGNTVIALVVPFNGTNYTVASITI
jgi:hypothetical protein